MRLRHFGLFAPAPGRNRIVNIPLTLRESWHLHLISCPPLHFRLHPIRPLRNSANLHDERLTTGKAYQGAMSHSKLIALP